MPGTDAVWSSIERARTGSERLRLAAELSDAARALAAAGIRERHPDWSDREVLLELVRYAFLTQEGRPAPC